MSVLVLLSGGGARGALEVPLVERLAPRATAWAGTSVGAIHAAAAASGKADVIRGVWESVEGIQDFMSRQLDAWNGLYSLNPILRKMDELDALAPVQPLWLGTYDYASARHRLVEASPRWTRDQVAAMVKCSASIPLTHEPACDLQGRPCGDGGIDAPLPPIPAGKWSEIHAVLCVPSEALPLLELDRVNGPLEQASRALDHMVSASVQRCVANLRKYKRQYPDTTIVLYQPYGWAHVGPTWQADRATIRARLGHGEWMADHGVELQ